MLLRDHFTPVELSHQTNLLDAAMARRFYLHPIPAAGMPLVVEGDQAHHAANVMRVQPGDSLQLFDGEGKIAHCQVQSVHRKKLELNVESVQQLNLEGPCRLTIAVALPKGDRQKFLIEKLVELGVERVVPLITRRGVAEPNPRPWIGLASRSWRQPNSASEPG